MCFSLCEGAKKEKMKRVFHYIFQLWLKTWWRLVAGRCRSPKVPAGDPGKHGPAVPSGVPEASEPGDVAALQRRDGPTLPHVWDPQWSTRTATLSPAQVTKRFHLLVQPQMLNTSHWQFLMCAAVNGAWSCWSSWSQCSSSCGGGHYQRTRTCSSPPPANGGDICIGLHTEEALCNTHPCEGTRTRIKSWTQKTRWSVSFRKTQIDQFRLSFLSVWKNIIITLKERNQIMLPMFYLKKIKASASFKYPWQRTVTSLLKCNCYLSNVLYKSLW